MYVQRYTAARSRNRCHGKATIRSLSVVVAIDAAVNNIRVVNVSFALLPSHKIFPAAGNNTRY